VPGTSIKTGTFGSEDKLNGKLMLNGKGLAGYVITKRRKETRLCGVCQSRSARSDTDAAQQVAGQALGEIAAAAYDADLSTSASPHPANYDWILRNGQVEFRSRQADRRHRGPRLARTRLQPATN